jgi:hypothetical protein
MRCSTPRITQIERLEFIFFRFPAQMAIAAEAAEEEAVQAKAKAVKRKVGGIAGAARARHAAAAAGASASGGVATPAATHASLMSTLSTTSPIWGLYSRIVDLFRDRFAVVAGLNVTAGASSQLEGLSSLDDAWKPLQMRLETLALKGTLRVPSILQYRH